MVIKVGDTAPDFTLEDQEGKLVNLSSFRGRKVLLSFHPLAWTSVCSHQMRDLEDNHARLQALNTAPLGLSVDSVPCKHAWAESLGIKHLKMPADFWPHGDVASLYGIFCGKDGVSERANILVDEERRVVFVRIYERSERPDLGVVLRLLG